MAKYVDVEKVFCAICEDRDRCGSPDLFCDVHSMPAEDVVPVGRGEWIAVPNSGIGNTAKCSCCGKSIYGYKAMNYCPNCGKYMREEREDE